MSYDLMWKEKNGGVWKATRRCEVKEEIRVTVPAGTYDTFHVVCDDDWRSRHWFVSPKLGQAVLYLSKNKRSGSTHRSELVSWDPGGANWRWHGC